MIASGGTNYSIVVRADARTLQRLACSVKWGCEVTFPADGLRDIKLTDSRFEISTVSAGPSVRVVLLPSAALVNEAGVVQPLQGMLRIIKDNREYDVLVTAKDIEQSYNLEFAVPVSIQAPATPAPTPAPVLQLGLDPADMDFGWSMSGASKHHCLSVFSYRGALWCKLPAGEDAIPSVFALEGHLQRPLNAIMMDRDYLVVQTPSSYMRFVWGEEPGEDMWIRRSRE